MAFSGHERLRISNKQWALVKKKVNKPLGDVKTGYNTSR
jgi:hypothetical protein